MFDYSSAGALKENYCCKKKFMAKLTVMRGSKDLTTALALATKDIAPIIAAFKMTVAL